MPATLLILILIGGYTLLGVVYLRLHNEISNVDFWYQIELGQKLTLASPATLADGLYPLGYPLVLRVAVQNGLDALRAGQTLAWFGGLLSVIALFGLVYRITNRPFVAFGACALLLTNVSFLRRTAFEGNDLLAAGLQVMALWLAWVMADQLQRREGLLLSAAAGVVIGFAYLVRYQSLIFLPVLVLLAILQPRRLLRRGFAVAGVLVLAFALTTLIQTVPSTLVHANPFYNTQAKNVWFGIYGGEDWVNNWGKVPDTISLRQVIALDPGAFFAHWWRAFSTFFWNLPLWTGIWRFAWLAGGVLLLFYRRLPLARRFVLLAALLLPVVATSMAWLGARTLLVPIVMQALLIALLAGFALDLAPPRAKTPAYVLMSLVFILGLIAPAQEAAAWIERPADDRATRVTSFLRSAGMTEATAVATNDPSLHAADEPARTRYSQTYWVDPAPADLDALLDQPAAAGWRYLVLDFANGLGESAALRQAVAGQVGRLAPLQLEGSPVIYCILPCLPDPIPDSFTFDNGMRLLAHSVTKSSDAAGVFLRWRAAGTIGESYKVSIRLLDGSGNLVGQVDGVPQLWTRPTNTWTPGEAIEDFYRVPAGKGFERVALAVYDASTGQQVVARDAAGQQLGPLIHLRNRE
jgi:hypothetical protein